MSALSWCPNILRTATRAVWLMFAHWVSGCSLRPFGDVYSLVFNPHCIVLFFLLNCDSFPFIPMLVCLYVAVADYAVICYSSWDQLLLFLSEAMWWTTYLYILWHFLAAACQCSHLSSVAFVWLDLPSLAFSVWFVQVPSAINCFILVAVFHIFSCWLL